MEKKEEEEKEKEWRRRVGVECLTEYSQTRKERTLYHLV